MGIKVCLCANTLHFPNVGGHLWVYLNWALALCDLGCAVIWLEGVRPNTTSRDLRGLVASLKSQLKRYDLAESLVLYSWNSEFSPDELTSLVSADACLNIESAVEADLLLNMAYGIPSELLNRFRRSALVDIDPGLSQIWMSEGQMRVEGHDVYFTIGETVGRPEARFPDCGLHWFYSPPPVYLPAWPSVQANFEAPYTTVTNWWGEWVLFQEHQFENGKRNGFMPFLNLPQQTSQVLELAISLGAEDKEWTESERMAWSERGWRVRFAHTVASTAWDYQAYIQSSRGEFSCSKPSCIRLQNAWVSDRTLCYLASGKPAVVQHTGPSRFLPDSAGLFRFRDIEEAARCLEMVAQDYEQQCKLARALAEEYFDGRKVVGDVLERALA